MYSFSPMILIAAGLTFMTLGCDEVARTYDCVKICAKYADCYDAELDQGACVDRCEAEGDADASFEKKANDCEACVSDKDCASATTTCLTKCEEVVVTSTATGGAAN